MLEHRKALLIGINRYPGPYALSYCVDDSKALEELLKWNDGADESPNFRTENHNNCEDAVEAINAIKKLFEDKEASTVLFYFAGHGYIDANNNGEIIFPHNITKKSLYYGIKMDDIMKIVSKSRIQNKIIILDCCNRGIIGNSETENNQVRLPDGCAIFASCHPNQNSIEDSEKKHGVFSDLLINALKGDAANFLGEITVGGLYAYIDRFIEISEQRPTFKSNISTYVSIRNVAPKVPFSRMRAGLRLFKEYNYCFPLSPEYEFSSYVNVNPEVAKKYPKCVTFQLLQDLQKIGFVEPVDEDFMYFAAMNSKSCRLTTLGKIYWEKFK